MIIACRTSDACASCGGCAGECPIGVVSQGDTQYVIDEPSYIDHGACEAVCPVGAIPEANWEESQ